MLDTFLGNYLTDDNGRDDVTERDTQRLSDADIIIRRNLKIADRLLTRANLFDRARSIYFRGQRQKLSRSTDIL